MSSFEEAIFRVYDRSMESMHDNSDSEEGSSQGKICKWFQIVSFCLAGFMALVLLTLHVSFVGQSGT